MQLCSRSAVISALAAVLAAWSGSAIPLSGQAVGTVRGAVTDATTQRPLAGAQVSVPGTGRRAVSTASGEYSLTGVPAGSQRVRIDLIGFTPIERAITVAAGQATTLNFALGAAAVSLDELVVTGTAGDARRRTVGNAVSTIRAADVVETAPVNNVQELISGRAPGVVVIPGTGMVGTGSRIRVRGSKSLSLSQEPLVYVDGVRVNNAQSSGPTNQGFGSNTISRWNDFNPEEIESIEIIKGPAAATLYGTEASNGVIQIITKKGVAGRARWNLSVRQGANWFANPEGRLWTNYGRACATCEIQSIDYNQLESNYGQDIFRTGHLQEYDLGVSGGSEAVRYFVGGSYERNQGIEPNNKLNRFNGRANVSASPSSKLDLTASLGYVTGRTDISLEAGGGGTTWSTFWMNPVNTRPLANGNPNPRVGFHSATPEAYYHAYQDWQDLDRFTGSLQATHRLTDWFTQRLAVGTDLTREDNVELVERIEDPAFQFFFSPGEIRGYKDVTTRNVTYNTFDYSGTATFDVRPGLASNTSVGAQFYRRYSEFVSAYGEDFPARGLRSIDAAATRRGGEDYVESTTVGVFAQQQFGWRDRLFLTAALRADDNSAFGENFDLVYYPKLSAAWVVSEEPFWNLEFVDNFRLRAAYGQSGQQPQSFAALRTFRPVPGPGDVGTVTPQLVGNPDLGPERGEEVEAGFEASFLNDRLGLDFTYYNTKTTDAILLRDIAPSTGFAGSQFINAGEIHNSGIELLARAQAISTPQLGLEFTFSFATNDNEVVDLGIEGLTAVSAGALTQHRVGYPVGSWFEKRVVGAQFDATGTLVRNSELCDDGQGGMVNCATAPLVFLGRPTPAREGAFSSTLTLFGNLRLYALVDFKQDFYKLDGNDRVRCNIFRRCRENFFPLEFVDQAARLATIQRGTAFVSELIHDASYSKLREVSATYAVPNRWAGTFGASRASITLAGRNLYTWTDYPGLEPEASFLGGSRGGGNAQWEQNVVPQLAQFVATVNLSF